MIITLQNPRAHIYFLSGPTKSSFSCICFKWIHRLCWTQFDLL